MSNKRTHHRKANEHTLNWLESNYELKEGICLPRCLLYQHYLDYTRKKSCKAIGAAAFGKLVRQKFPKITTRRLGTRGQSKYHYYGVGIRKTSIYFADEKQIQNQNKIQNRVINKEKVRNKGFKMQTIRKSVVRALKTTAQVMPQLVTVKPQLRHFPRASDFVVPFDVQRDKLSTFLIMYRSHCQRILDTIIVANTDEVNKYLSHFWSGIPQHLTDLLDNEFMVNVIECADSVLYSAIEGSLTPKSLYELPEQFTQELVRILTLMPKWIEQSMKTLSTQIMAKKLEVLQQFSAAIRRQLSFLQLVKSCKIVVSQPENVTLMCREIKCVETQEIWSQMVTLLSDSVLSETIRKSFSDLIHGIAQDISFEYITDWVNSIVDRYVVNGKYACLTSRASQLVFALGTYLSGIIRDLTLNNAKSFGFWHLLFVTLEEYTLLTVCRSIRHESQSVRRLTIMKQPLNNSQQNNCFNNNHINNNATSQAISSVPDSVVDNNCPQQTYNDVNQWMALQCYQWDQYSDDYSQNYSSPTTYSWTDSQYVECLNDQFMANTNPTITSNGNVYTCLS